MGENPAALNQQTEPPPGSVLTLNTGSSSLKFAVYRLGPGEDLLMSGALDRIGLAGGRFRAHGCSGAGEDRALDLADHAAAVQELLRWLDGREGVEITAIAHRVVQGGPDHTKSEVITPALMQELRELCRIDPPHLPAAIAGIEAAQKFRPGAVQVACFDTAFHRTMPRVAQMLPLPREMTERLGLMRYGFHGLSYEYIIGELARMAGDTAAQGRVIIAHLGNGASMAALQDGRSVETSMGFTPAGGLVMSSRSGDLDPGVVVHLVHERGLTSDELNDLIYKKSGLLGVSGLSSDMRDLEAAAATNPQAKEAIELFCYQGRKTIGAFAAVLDGLDTLIFTGGIGEHSSRVRARIGAGLAHLGVSIEPAKNDANDAVISRDSAPVTVRVIKTNEELVMARHTAKILDQTAVHRSETHIPS